jgi:hypothetical protein
MSDKLPLRCENNAPRFIIAPPTPSFPNGIRLQPGLNTWPSLYAHEVEQLPKKKRTVNKNGKISQVEQSSWDRFVEMNTAPIVIHTVEGRRVGPMLTFYYEALEDREDGPEPPAVLPANEKAALAIVNATSGRQKAALERWLPLAKGAVKSAIESKLHG